ncbi:MAG: transglutaminase family protein [Flavisolibacter sp.]
MPVFKILHITKYDYEKLVSESVNEIRIYPFQSSEQEVLHHELHITGSPQIHTYFDYWQNKTGVFNLIAPHKELLIESHLIIRATASAELTVNFEAGFERLEEVLVNDIKMVELSTPDSVLLQDRIQEMVKEIYVEGKGIAATVGDCCTYIFENFNYIKGITDIETTVDEVLEKKAGVCQDFAHVMLQVLRTLKIPTRYVSGYICPNKDGMRGEGATHAWVEAWIPPKGWAGIDPTNNVWVTNKHIKLALGRNFKDCTPVKGAFKGAAHQKLSVYVSVSYEDGHMFHATNDVVTNLSHQYESEPGLDMQQ